MAQRDRSMYISAAGPGEKPIRARNRAILISLIGFCAYIPVAYWGLQQRSDDGPPPSAGIRVRIQRPYTHRSPAAVAVSERVGMFENAENWRKVEVWEGDKRLVPATVNDAASFGPGQYVYERDRGLTAGIIWSSSDNTDPVTNGRSYWLVNPRE